MPRERASGLKLLVSHRPEDEAIGKALATALQRWGGAGLRIHRSPAARGMVRGIGEELTAAEKDALSDVDAVLLVYTVSDASWLYCMWECGAATSRNRRSTPVVVFQCGRDLPASLRQQRIVMMDDDSIREFVRAFHTDPAFFADVEGALAPDVAEAEIEARAEEFLSHLRAENSRRRLAARDN